MRILSRSIVIGAVSVTFSAACRSPQTAAPPARDSKDAAFTAAAHDYLEDLYRRLPTQATYLGVHKYDDKLENYSRQAVAETVAASRQFRERIAAIDQASLSADNQLDRVQLLHAIDSRLLTLEVVRPLGARRRHLQQRHHQHGLHHDQAGICPGRGTPAQVDRP